jgi:hypothetical protein
MIDWLDKHLVDDWRKAWKWSSVQLAAVFGTAITAFAANPNLMLSIINYMPADPTQRALAAVAVGAIAFFGPTVLRLWQQGAKPERTDG